MLPREAIAQTVHPIGDIMLNTINVRAANVGDSVFVASRQVWLASLGAAVVTREWAEKEAGTVFRHLVKEGSVIESRAVRMVGDRLETSFERANALWRSARSTVTSTVKTYADTAVALARELPRSLPRMEAPAIKATPATKRMHRTAKTRKPHVTGTAKKVRRTAKRAAKRG